MNKLPGKTIYSGRRRSMTRKSGFKSHPNSTGGEYKILEIEQYLIPAGKSLRVHYIIPACNKGDFVGFGGWFCATNTTNCQLSFSVKMPPRTTLTTPCYPDWSKVGSMWQSNGNKLETTFEIKASDKSIVAVWEMNCGIIDHQHLTNARVVLLKNMYQFSPEANFYKTPGVTSVHVNNGETVGIDHEKTKLYLKSCNRCARYLPINIGDERRHLSFTNHCVATHRRPCSHGGFGRLRNVDTKEILQLDYGYQLECRFCKKFEVNAAHNPQRTASQMKEDAARRRSFELLLMELYGGSPQLLYRHKTGRELADDIWNNFGKKCFKCSIALSKNRYMHLDHTRPLALLWPLDETATSLCGSCNSQKRDRPPIEFYSEKELDRLARITGIPIHELKDPSPNHEAIDYLLNRIDWFFNDFLTKPELTKVREGKNAGELLIKALQKVFNRLPGGPPINLQSELEKRRSRY